MHSYTLTALSLLAIFGLLESCGNGEGRATDPLGKEQKIREINGKITDSKILGFNVRSAGICKEGRTQVYVQPIGEDNAVVTGQYVSSECQVTVNGESLRCIVKNTNCSAAKSDAQKVMTAVAIDNSGSMSANDRNNLRFNACEAYIDTVREGDKVAVGDYGSVEFSGSDTKTVDKGLTTYRVFEDLSTDRAASKSGCSRGKANQSTPLYAASREAIELLGAAVKVEPDYQGAVLLLSDGEPTDSESHDTVSASQIHKVPVYTVGLVTPFGEQYPVIGSTCSTEADCATLGTSSAITGCATTTYSGTQTVCTLKADSSPILLSAYDSIGQQTKAALTAAGLLYEKQCSADDECTLDKNRTGFCNSATNTCWAKHDTSTSDPGKALAELASATAGTYMAATSVATLDKAFTSISDAIINGQCVVTMEIAQPTKPWPIASEISGTISLGMAGALPTPFTMYTPGGSEDETRYCETMSAQSATTP